MLGLGQAEATKYCSWHNKRHPVSEFDLNLKTGLPYALCRRCKYKQDAAQAEYQKRAKRKAAKKRAKTIEKGKASGELGGGGLVGGKLTRPHSY